MSDRTVRPVDVDRGRGASFHLQHALIHARTAQVRADHGDRTGARRSLTMAGSHMRTARGYLGAIGFEGGWRL